MVKYLLKNVSNRPLPLEGVKKKVPVNGLAKAVLEGRNVFLVKNGFFEKVKKVEEKEVKKVFEKEVKKKKSYRKKKRSSYKKSEKIIKNEEDDE